MFSSSISFTKFITITSLLSALSLTACDLSGNSVVGEWESSDVLECRGLGEYRGRNVLEIDGEEGEATLLFTVTVEGTADCSYAEYDLEIEEDDGDYEIEFTCIDTNSVLFDCSALDFTAECEVDGDDLECEAEGIWETYELEFERD